MIRILFITIFFATSACQTGPSSPSSRSLEGISKPDSPYMHGRVPQGTSQELFVQKKELVVEDVQQDNETGSLYNVNDQRNYLFLTTLPVSVGQYLEIAVLADAATKKADAATPAAADKAPAAESSDQVVKEMLAQLPQLDAGEANPALIKSLKMRVEKVYENGDVLATFRRASSNPTDDKTVSVSARIPLQALQSGDPLSTQNLSDVKWTDNFDGQMTDRSSPNWQDEYSLRLSGFTEAKSLFARQLEDKRKQLQGVRDRLNNQLVSFGKERAKVAQEREAALKSKADAENKLTEVEKVLEERSSELSKFQEEKLALDAEAAKANVASAKASGGATVDAGKTPQAANPAAAKPAANTAKKS